MYINKVILIQPILNYKNMFLFQDSLKDLFKIFKPLFLSNPLLSLFLLIIRKIYPNCCNHYKNLPFNKKTRKVYKNSKNISKKLKLKLKSIFNQNLYHQTFRSSIIIQSITPFHRWTVTSTIFDFTRKAKDTGITGGKDESGLKIYKNFVTSKNKKICQYFYENILHGYCQKYTHRSFRN